MSYIRFKSNEYVAKQANKLYKIGNVQVYAPNKAEARRRFMAYHGTTEIKKVDK